MAEYINIKGQNIEVVASDPANPTIGQIWYNSTSNTLKAFDLTTSGSFSTIPSLNSPRGNMAVGGAGDATAGLAYGGWPSPNTAKAESYDGSTWTTENNMTQGGHIGAGFGTQTAAVKASGSITPSPGYLLTTEEYNGTSWTTSGNTTYAATYLAGAGIESAGLMAGGADTGAYNNNSAEYNGSTWTSGNSVPNVLNYHSGCGTQTAALMGASQATTPQQFFEYDGTSWTSTANLGSSVYSRVLAGIQTSAIYWSAGNSPNPFFSKTYDGSTWSTGPDALFSNQYGAGSGQSAAGYGAFGVASTNAQEFNAPGLPQTRTITAS